MSESDSLSESKPSILVTLSGALGSISPWPAVIGVVAIQARMVEPMTAFTGLLASLGLALLATLLSAVALSLADKSQAASTRRPAWRGLATGGAVLGVVVLAVAPNLSAPSINDISTDLENPPSFNSAGLAPQNRGKNLEYPGAFAPIVRDAYPDLKTAELKVPTYIAHYRAKRAADELGWVVVADLPETGTLEARDTSTIFHFVDDIIVRILPGRNMTSESLVDIRSRSRDGKGDLGANARRIRNFIEVL